MIMSSCFSFFFNLFDKIYLIVLIRNVYHGVYLLKLNKKIHFDRNQSLVGGLKYPFLKSQMIPNKKQIVFGKIFLLLRLEVVFFLRFLCGKTIFLFTSSSLNKNDEFIIATNTQIRSFLIENQKQFTFSFGNNQKIRLEDIFDQLEKTQIYFDR
jgi:hypothetical protein